MMVQFTQDRNLTINEMDMENYHIKKEDSMKDIGKMTSIEL